MFVRSDLIYLMEKEQCGIYLKIADFSQNISINTNLMPFIPAYFYFETKRKQSLPSWILHF
jgi:hypothetical protein